MSSSDSEYFTAEEEEEEECSDFYEFTCSDGTVWLLPRAMHTTAEKQLPPRK